MSGIVRDCVCGATSANQRSLASACRMRIGVVVSSLIRACIVWSSSPIDAVRALVSLVSEGSRDMADMVTVWEQGALIGVGDLKWVVSRRRAYSRGQAKSTNLVSRQIMDLQPWFFQILVPICEIRRKTHLRSFSHDKLAWPEFWT